MELTQEYFDQGLERITSDVRQQIETQTQELKEYTHEAFEAQQKYMEEHLKEDIGSKVREVERDVRRIKTHLHLG